MTENQSNQSETIEVDSNSTTNTVGNGSINNLNSNSQQVQQQSLLNSTTISQLSPNLSNSNNIQAESTEAVGTVQPAVVSKQSTNQGPGSQPGSPSITTAAAAAGTKQSQQQSSSQTQQSQSQSQSSASTLSQLGKNLDKFGHNIAKNMEKVDKFGKKAMKTINNQTGVGSFISSLTQTGKDYDLDDDHHTLGVNPGSPVTRTGSTIVNGSDSLTGTTGSGATQLTLSSAQSGTLGGVTGSNMTQSLGGRPTDSQSVRSQTSDTMRASSSSGNSPKTTNHNVNLNANANPQNLNPVSSASILKDIILRIQAHVPKRLKDMREECQRTLDFVAEYQQQNPTTVGPSAGPVNESSPSNNNAVTSPSESGGTTATATVVANSTPAVSTSTNSATKLRADEFFTIWKLGIPEAVKDQSLIKMAQSMLTGLQKLLETGLIVGDGPDYITINENKKREEAGTTLVQVPADRILMDQIMDTICDVVRIQEETVLTQLVSVISAAILQPNTVVRGATLMQGIRSCFQSYREVKSINAMRQTHETLKAIVVLQCQRMEQEAQNALKVAQRKEKGVSDTKVAQRKEKGLDEAAKVSLDQWLPGYVNVLVDKTIQDQPQYLVVEENGVAGKFGWCIICREPAPHYCLETKDPVCSRECKQINLERQANLDYHFPPPGLQNKQQQLQTTSSQGNTAVTTTSSSSSSAMSPSSQQTNSKNLSPAFLERLPLHRDTFMVFASLCKLSIKDIPQMDQKFIKSKRLTLELIFAMLQHAGPVFRSSEKFIAAIKTYLCLAIVRNCLSSVPKIFGLSLSIFLVLVQHFKEHMKFEIPIFIETIFIRILDSGNCTFAHKQRVLSVFYKLCTDPNTAIELFVNYDCDLHEKNLFEKMLDVLGKIAQGKFSNVEYSVTILPHQDQELRVLALEALFGLMNSIVSWSQLSELPANNSSNSIEDLNPVTKGMDVVAQKKRKLELQAAVEKFNTKPKKGIEALMKGGFVPENEPEALVDFMRRTTSLDKTAIGDYLGENMEFNQKVLHTMINSNSFKDLDLDVALRMFLADFRLPGEAQKIDRMVEKFAAKYCTDNPENPEFGTNEDCAYVLAFSLVMLQTDLHNDNIKNKMTVEAFETNNRGINNGKNLSSAYLAKLYNNIQRTPITLSEDDDARARLESQNAQTAVAKMDLFNRESVVMIGRATKSFESIKDRQKRQIVQAASQASAALTAGPGGPQIGARDSTENSSIINCDNTSQFDGSTSVILDQSEVASTGKGPASTISTTEMISDTISVVSHITTATQATTVTQTGASTNQESQDLSTSPTAAGSATQLAGTLMVGGSSSSTATVQQTQTKIALPPQYVSADSLQRNAVGRPLFEVMCWPMLATLSVLLETTNWITQYRDNQDGSNDANGQSNTNKEDEQNQIPENRMIELSVHAMRLCIKFASRLSMDTERDAFVSSLAKFTYLATLKEMTQKNVECIKVLLDIGLTDGNFLANSWVHILHCISHLERLHLIRTLKPDSHFFDDGNSNSNSNRDSHSPSNNNMGGGHSPSSGHDRTSTLTQNVPVAAGVFGSALTTAAANLTGQSLGLNSSSTNEIMSQGGSGSGSGISSSDQQIRASNGSLRTTQHKRKVGTTLAGVIRMSEEELHTEYLNSETIISQINPSDIDKLFGTSTNLSAQAIVDFVTALTQVSADELSLRSQDQAEPRIFSLQKLVEVADANMQMTNRDERGKVVWTKIWKVLSGHFSDVVVCRNMSVVMYALDSLRQLAMKFLSKSDLAEYNFQSDFLRPMELVVSSPTGNLEAKYFVISVVQNLMKANHTSIKGGWKSLFFILEQTTKPQNMGIPISGSKDSGTINWGALTKEQQQTRKTLILNSFAVLQGAIENHQQYFVSNFSEGMKALVGFAQCPMLSTAQALEAIQLIFNAAAYLSTVGDITNDSTNKSESNSNQIVESSDSKKDSSNTSQSNVQNQNNSNKTAHQWFPLLRALCTLSSDNRKEVRTRALNGLFDLLKAHGGKCFDHDTWQMVFRGVLFPLFDDIQLEVIDRKQQDTICLSAFSNCVSLVDTHFTQLSFLLHDVIQVLAQTVTHTVESVARLGVEALKQLIEKSGDKFSKENWELIAQNVHHLFEVTTPVPIQDELYTALVRQHQLRTGGAVKKTSAAAGVAKGQAAQRPGSQVGQQQSQGQGQQRESVGNRFDPVSRTEQTQAESSKDAVNNVTSETGETTGSAVTAATSPQQQTQSQTAVPPPPPQQQQPGQTNEGDGPVGSITTGANNSSNQSQTKSQQSTVVNTTQSAASQVEEVTRSVVTGCVVQLLLIDCVHNTFEKHAELIPRPVIVTILEALESSFTFAHEFNQKISLRLELKRLGFMRDMRDLPGLLKQEREGLTCYLGILFGLYSMGRLDKELCERLTFCSRCVIKNYCQKDRLMQTMMREGDDEVQAVEFERETTGLQPIITQVILHNLIEADNNNNTNVNENGVDSNKDNSEKVNTISKDSAGVVNSPNTTNSNNISSELSTEKTTITTVTKSAATVTSSSSKTTTSILPDSQIIVKDLFKTVCPVIFPLLCDLCVATSSELRMNVREVLLVKVGPMMGMGL